MTPWSVTETAGIPARSASLKIVGAWGLDRGASIRAAPSSSEYSEWVWRWTKLSPWVRSSSPGIRAGGRLPWSVVASGSRREAVMHRGPGAMRTTYRAVIRRVRRLAPLPSPSRPLVPTSAIEGLGQVAGQRLLDVDPRAARRMRESEPLRVEERASQPEPRRLLATAPV